MAVGLSYNGYEIEELSGASPEWHLLRMEVSVLFGVMTVCLVEIGPHGRPPDTAQSFSPLGQFSVCPPLSFCSDLVRTICARRNPSLNLAFRLLASSLMMSWSLAPSSELGWLSGHVSLVADLSLVARSAEGIAWGGV